MLQFSRWSLCWFKYCRSFVTKINIHIPWWNWGCFCSSNWKMAHWPPGRLPCAGPRRRCACGRWGSGAVAATTAAVVRVEAVRGRRGLGTHTHPAAPSALKSFSLFRLRQKYAQALRENLFFHPRLQGFNYIFFFINILIDPFHKCIFCFIYYIYHTVY